MLALDVQSLNNTFESKLRDFEASWMTFVWPSDVQINAEVRNYGLMNQMMLKLRSGVNPMTQP